ncbi:hypothetical protein COV58_04025 [Candidatus Roizmanbacteria bacterium CG11_big_fil_rev_8_21_14_0_20_36_8]|uniref:Uncharacterized protein n=2 Tax=Candidatus Roizmaniibacteriota TaxID=1752723 RepID=A0A2M6ITC1_9BACT|nr:MAG: hypothetical protein COV58_04025 [Candidatus Roizmanbacteria bacterium CG11_big_fil_rev_8_21_14_0_20_36_8]PIZ65876.1 MAG: hypothetical protein COY14_01505 [Candidatus Roizmanbacteria bacterium CG_4_10_14_0_2_um_filter_36_9]
MELVTVIGSDLFDLDDYIKSYLLEHSDMSFETTVKIIIRYYVKADVILQLNVFEDYPEKINPFMFLEVFGRRRNDRKIC